MKNRIQSLAFVATLAVAFGMISGGSALAQTSPSSTDQATPQTQPTPDTPPATQQAPTAQTPDQTAPPASNNGTPSTGTPSNSAPSTGATNSGSSNNGAAAASDSQSFSGTIEKSGDKYVLKDDSGKTYDIDHQTDVAKFEGKRVRVKGMLDPTGTKIMVK